MGAVWSLCGLPQGMVSSLASEWPSTGQGEAVWWSPKRPILTQATKRPSCVHSGATESPAHSLCPLTDPKKTN